MNKEEAVLLVQSKLDELGTQLPNGDKIIILENESIEKEWGWVVFYTSEM